jgi:hypothetical protein
MDTAGFLSGVSGEVKPRSMVKVNTERKPLLVVAPGCRIEKPRKTLPQPEVWVVDEARKRQTDYQKPTWLTSNLHTEWSAEEDKVVLESGLTDVEIAKQLGRTQRAVYGRRYVLNQMSRPATATRETFLKTQTSAVI